MWCLLLRVALLSLCWSLVYFLPEHRSWPSESLVHCMHLQLLEEAVDVSLPSVDVSLPSVHVSLPSVHVSAFSRCVSAFSRCVSAFSRCVSAFSTCVSAFSRCVSAFSRCVSALLYLDCTISPCQLSEILHHFLNRKLRFPGHQISRMMWYLSIG